MSKRYSPKNPHQGSQRVQQVSTSPQKDHPRESRIVCEHYMRQIVMNEFYDKFLRLLFLGKHEKKEKMTDKEGMVSRMVQCWMNEKAKCGPREYLEELMEKNNIEREVDGRWAKYKILKAPLVISPRIEVTKPGQWKQFLNLFLNKDFISDQKRSECAVRFRQAKNMTELEVAFIENLQYQIVIYPWTEFSAKNPRQLNEIYHAMQDEDGLLQHIMLNRSQLEYLDHLYKDPRDIRVVRSNWKEYIENIKGGRVQQQDFEEGMGIIQEEKYPVKSQVVLVTSRIDDQVQQVVSQQFNDHQVDEIIEVIKKRQQQPISTVVSHDQLCNEWKETIQELKWDEEVFRLDKNRDFYAQPEYIGKISLMQEKFVKEVSKFLRFILKLNITYANYIQDLGMSLVTSSRENTLKLRDRNGYN